MWEAIVTWIKAIAIVVVLGNLAEFLLPQSALKRYAGLVVGLLLLLFMVRPLGQILTFVQHPQLKSQGLVPLGTGQSVQQLIAQEEIQNIEAMVETVPGVRWCTAQSPSPTRMVVHVGVDQSIDARTLKAFVNQTVVTVTQNSHMAVSVSTQIVPNPPLPQSAAP